MERSEIGIKYKRIRIDRNKYILLPVGYEEGYSVGEIFYSMHNLRIPVLKEVLENDKIVVDSIMGLEDLFSMYEYDDKDLIKEYYYIEEKDNILLMEVQGDVVLKRKLVLSKLMTPAETEVLQKINDEISIILNDTSVDKLLTIDDIGAMKQELLKIKEKLSKFRLQEEDGKTTRIIVEDGHVKEIVTKYKVPKNVEIQKSVLEGSESVDDSGISLKGLEQYVKERVFGHDDEIKRIAKTLIMNSTATDEEERESILIVGPTGTGKTATLKAVSSYLDMPFSEVNAINLDPQGIRGESLEDHLFSLLVQTNFEQEKAEKGLFLVDEIDKLGLSKLDLKEPVKDILLKLTEGGDFYISRLDGDYEFNTSRLSKVYAGAFTKIFETPKTMGFNQTVDSPSITMDSKEVIKKIEEAGYYGTELLTRINYVNIFRELSREVKKDILLRSKLSVYLKKKQRYKRQFNVDLQADDSYIEAILDNLDFHKESIRELNNVVRATLDEIEYELLSANHSGKTLVLTRAIVDDNKKFNL